MAARGEEAAFGGAPELTRITAITTATAATTLPIIAQTSVRPRRIGPPRPSCLSLGNLASSPCSGLARLAAPVACTLTPRVNKTAVGGGSSRARPPARPHPPVAGRRTTG